MYPGAARLLFGLIIAPPCPTTPAPVQCATGNPLGPNNLLASRSKCTLFGHLNVKHAFNMTRGPTTGGEMLWGLPLSKELGRWSGHSGSSSTSSSSASVTSYGYTSSCSSASSGTTTGLSVYDPVRCRCVSAYAKGSSDKMNTMNMLACKVDEHDSL
jgi:hypothetical protein